MESELPRYECRNGHVAPPYVVVENVYCPVCGDRWKGVLVDGEFLGYPFEHCAICLRNPNNDCGTCEGPVLVAVKRGV